MADERLASLYCDGGVRFPLSLIGARGEPEITRFAFLAGQDYRP